MSYKDVDASTSRPYMDPTPMPGNVPHVEELGVTSAPLKSSAFFIGAYCKEYNGDSFLFIRYIQTKLRNAEDFMLCKDENRSPEHCLKEGRRVTRCAADLQVHLPDTQSPSAEL
jgi:NADH dehydrogenase (ubiquinone) 1 alpha subcomplex subunit 8